MRGWLWEPIILLSTLDFDLMSPRPHPIKASRAASIALILLFIAMINLPLLDSIFNLDQTSQVNENRMLAKFPTYHIGFNDVRGYVSNLESYYNDHFGFRKRLIYWGHTWKREWFNDTLKSGAVIGQRGWLYGAEGLGLKADGSRLSAPFTLQELQSWQAVFETRAEWLKKRGIHYLVIIPPEKQSVYAENLPVSVQQPNTAAKLGQLFNHIKTHSTVDLLDLRPVLMDAKRNGRVFHMTDTHWNQYGAFVACNAVISKLSLKLPQLSPLSLDSFALTYTNFSGGNLAVLLASANSMVENSSPVLLPRLPLKVMPMTEYTTNWAMIKHVANPAQSYRALCFCDSFAEALLPFFGQSFNEFSLYRLYDRSLVDNNQNRFGRAHIWNRHVIEAQKPDVVIDEILETFLLLEDPDYIRRQDALE